VPYLTPPDLPEGDVCRPLSIPESTEWLALFGGALTELTKVYNWEYSGGLSVQDTVDLMTAIVDNWYTNACASCELPGGTPPFRIGENGHLQQLVDGEWVEPTGDYTIPPTAPREEPTPDERICLAAANAAHVLELLYENLADSLSESLSAVDAAAAWAAAVVGGIGLVIGAITGGMLEAAGFIFASVYAAVEWLTEDLWDAEFTETLVCILVQCASEEDDVVHFDFDCVYEQLRANTDLLDPTLSTVRLLAQVSFMIGWVGSEGLDAAGATTEIESYDCSPCLVWCYEWFFDEDDGDWLWTENPSTGGVWTDGVGWQASIADEIYKNINIERLVDRAVTHLEFTFEADGSPSLVAGNLMYYENESGFHLLDYEISGTGTVTVTWDGMLDLSGASVLFYVNLDTDTVHNVTITHALFRGEGTNPFGVSNCPAS